MKKSLWGYNIQEVDESICYFESQTIKLERQVKQLTAELNKAKTELEEASILPTDVLNAEQDGTVAELREKLAQVENANKELTAQNAELTQRINEVSEKASANEPFESIGNICKLAYSDIHTSKQKAKESLESFLNDFWLEWKTYEKRLAELSALLDAKRNESRESFISYADYVLKVYGDMESTHNDFDGQISEIAKSKSKIENSLYTLLSELDKDFDTEDNSSNTVLEQQESPVKAETDPESENKSLIIEAIKKLNERKTADEPQMIHGESEFKNQPVGITVSEQRLPDDRKGEMNISQKVNIRNII